MFRLWSYDLTKMSYVSVIMLIISESDLFIKIKWLFLKQNCTKNNFEIIIIDDMATDDTINKII